MLVTSVRRKCNRKSIKNPKSNFEDSKLGFLPMRKLLCENFPHFDVLHNFKCW